MLTLIHDVSSPASLLAVIRCQALADSGHDVRFEGLDRFGLGMAIPAPLELLAEWQTHREALAALGWHLPRPERAVPTADVHLLALAAEEAGLGAAYRAAAYRAALVEDRDLLDRDVLRGLGAEVGLDAEAVDARLGDEALRAQVRARAVKRRSGGVGGVPLLDVDGSLVPALMPESDLADLAAIVAAPRG